MSAIFSKPDIPKPPPIPTRDDTQAAADLERRRRAEATGRRETILGGSPGSSTSVSPKVLLGE